MFVTSGGEYIARKCTTRVQRIYFEAFVSSRGHMHYLDIDKSPIKMSTDSFRFFSFFGGRATVQLLTSPHATHKSVKLFEINNKFFISGRRRGAEPTAEYLQDERNGVKQKNARLDKSGIINLITIYLHHKHSANEKENYSFHRYWRLDTSGVGIRSNKFKYQFTAIWFALFSL